MLYREIFKILGVFCLGFAAVLLIPLFLSIYYDYFADQLLYPQKHTTISFLESIAACLAIGAGLLYLGKKAQGHIYRREGLAAVVLIWVLSPFLGGMPFYFNGALDNPWASYFEATSALTTTGATAMQAKAYDATGNEIPITKTLPGVINTTYTFFGTITPVRNPANHAIIRDGIEAVGKALLFWRSFMQWLGGVGIVVLFIAILPALGAGGKVLYQTEVPGPVKDSFTPRIRETAIQLWKIYLFLTVLQTISLMFTTPKMEWLDAITITFSTLSTGGFSIRNDNIAFYESAAVDWIVVLFMILGSINFALYFHSLRGKFYRLYEPEFIIYLCVLVVVCTIGVVQLAGTPIAPLSGAAEGVYKIGSAIRYGVFQIVSAITSTGFSTADYDTWPYTIQVLMLIVMFIGGMSGSTAGGIKIIRHYMMFKTAQYKIEGLFRPETIRNFKVGNKEIDSSSTTILFTFFILCVFCSILGTYLYVLNGETPETAIGLVACMVNNTGLAFRIAGPTDSCAFMNDFAFFISSFLMLVGRLEFIAVFALFVPAFWKQNS